MAGHRIRALALVVLAGASLALAACTSSSSASSSTNNPGQGEAQVGEGVPVKNGTVVVRQGNKIICTMTVVNGKGTCNVPAQSFGPGTSQIVGSYSGQGYRDSQSAPLQFTVLPSKTATPTP